MPKSRSKKLPDPPPRLRYIALFAFGVLAVGAVFYHYIEHLSWLDSFYFCVITLTTIGYGDITPQTDTGKLFTLFYVLVGIGLLGASVNYILRRRLSLHMQIRKEKDSKG